MNVKFPGKVFVPPQKMSIFSHSGLNRPPPGFENFNHARPKSKLSGFVPSNNFESGMQRGTSPETKMLEPPVSKRRPYTKRSHQTVVVPLVPNPDLKSDFYLYNNLSKEKFTSDSLSDDNDQDLIKEEENDDSEEEKYSNNSVNKISLKNLS
jgi:hypothetical protein